MQPFLFTMKKLFLILSFPLVCFADSPDYKPIINNSSSGGATIAHTSNLINGDGSGNGSDSGIAPSSVVIATSTTKLLQNNNASILTGIIYGQAVNLADTNHLFATATAFANSFGGQYTYQANGTYTLDVGGAAQANLYFSGGVWHWFQNATSCDATNQNGGFITGTYTSGCASFGTIAFENLTNTVIPFNIVTNGEITVPQGLPQPAAYWSARSLNLSNGAAITSWPDLSGNGFNLVGTGLLATFTNGAIGGLPAINFNGGKLTNSALCAALTAQVHNHFTMLVVFQDLGQTGNSVLLEDTSDNLYIFPYAIVGGGWDAAGQDDMVINGSPLHSTAQGNQIAKVLTQRYSSAISDYDGWVNGRLFESYLSDGAVPNAPTISGVFSVGAKVGGGVQFFGNISEVILFTNDLTIAQCDILNNYFDILYGKTAKNVVMDGDSIIQGQQASANGDLPKLVSPLLNGYDIDVVAQPGKTSAQQLVNAYNWVQNIKRQGNQNIATFLIGDNDFANMNTSQATTQMPTTLTNLILYCNLMHSFNWQVLLSTVPSSFRETNGFRTNMNNWITANYKGIADGVIDYSGSIPAIGTNGAYVNTTYFFTDQLHPLTAAYQLMAPVLQAAIYRLIGNNFPTFIQTNFLSNQIYLNLSGNKETVYSDEFIVSAALGNTGFRLLYDPAGGTTWQTNCDGVTIQVAASIVGMTNPERLTGPIPIGASFVWSNFSTVGSATLRNGFITVP